MMPTLVKDLYNVGQVACGNTHTLALSQDGRTMWSWGGGDNGKDTTLEVYIQCWLVLEMQHV